MEIHEKKGHMVETYGTFLQISGFKRNFCEKDIHVKRAIWYLETYVTETYGGTFPQVSDCKRNYFEKDIHVRRVISGRVDRWVKDGSSPPTPAAKCILALKSNLGKRYTCILVFACNCTICASLAISLVCLWQIYILTRYILARIMLWPDG